MEEEAIVLIVELIEVCQQPVFEVRVEVAGIQNEIRVLLEKIHRERLRIVRIGEVTCDVLNREGALPCLVLRAVMYDFRDTVACEAVVGREDKLLFEPEVFLEVFYVGEEVDEFGGFKPSRARG